MLILHLLYLFVLGITTGIDVSDRVCVCVCVSHPGQRVLPHHFHTGRGAVDHYHSLPNEDSDRSVVKQCGTPHCVPAEFFHKLSPYFSTI